MNQLSKLTLAYTTYHAHKRSEGFSVPLFLSFIDYVYIVVALPSGGLKGTGSGVIALVA